MHFLYFVVTEPEKEFDIDQIGREVQSVLESNNFAGGGGMWGGGKCDWFVIGGRWSGELSRLLMDKDYYDEVKKQLDAHTDYFTDEDIAKHSDKMQEIWKKMGGLGDSPYLRSRYDHSGHEDDSMIITKDLLKKIKKRYEDKGIYGPVECFITEEYDEISVKDLDENSIGKVITVIDYHE